MMHFPVIERTLWAMAHDLGVEYQISHLIRREPPMMIFYFGMRNGRHDWVVALPSPTDFFYTDPIPSTVSYDRLNGGSVRLGCDWSRPHWSYLSRIGIDLFKLEVLSRFLQENPRIVQVCLGAPPNADKSGIPVVGALDMFNSIVETIQQSLFHLREEQLGETVILIEEARERIGV
jgi:hypothetical protein